MTVLDIGRSRLTELIHERYDVRVDALGFLAHIAEDAGLTVDRWLAGNYFDYRFVEGAGERHARLGRPLNLIYRCAPPSLKPGQTLVVRRR